MASELNTTNVKIVTDSDITIIDENFLPVVKHHYQVEFNVTGNILIHTRIRNSTMKNLNLHLNRNTGSISIEQNNFTGSGIVIVDLSAQVIIQNNIFQGEMQRSLLEIVNAKNIHLKDNYFENLHYTYASFKEEKMNSGIICQNSYINLHDSTFKHVKLDTLLRLHNCSVKVENINILESIPAVFNTFCTLVNMEHSTGNFSNLMFTNN